jgi:hypothetical protein
MVAFWQSCQMFDFEGFVAASLIKEFCCKFEFSSGIFDSC